MAADRRVAEGLEHLKEAEKCMKTSFFKWKADYDGAASAYTKAGTCFKTAKSYDQARQAFLKAAECNVQNNVMFHAGKAYEQAGMMCKELNDLNRAAQLIEKAGHLYREHGVPDTAASTFDRVAKLLEPTNPQKSVEYYLIGSDITECEDRPRQAADFQKKAAKLLVRMGNYDRAVEVLKVEKKFQIEGENGPEVSRVTVELVLCQLARGDFVAAEKAYKDAYGIPGFTESDHCRELAELLDAYDENDQERLSSVAARPMFKFMDNDYAKLARGLQAPGGGEGGKKKKAELLDEGIEEGMEEGQLENQEDGGGEDEDEFAGGLC
uniref:Gamma-soluble NSF attachment protein n=1 Tax=Branchiostoma floridae TaxID=7739 RepID=C3YCL6_BRAFL|eukprot:XP_002606043.1 hypothetical protein BRAFLDRAFT_285193 [Branchiostoma floridae]